MRNSMTEQPAVFGLTYLEEEEVEVTDVVGCFTVDGSGRTATGCDDTDLPQMPIEIP